MREKCIIWGMGKNYETILNQINFEICKGNIEIVAIVCRSDDRYCTYRDGFPVIVKEGILNGVKFDYIIVSSSQFYKEIKMEAVSLGVSENRIINGEVFKIPLFDCGLYSRLIKNPVTIITDDCWGGYVYHYLGLEFSSPLINTFWDKTEYAKFIQKPLFYLKTDLSMVREGDLKAGIYPIGRLGEQGDYVEILFVHCSSFAEAKQQWDRRRKRINTENIFVKMGFSMSDQNAPLYIKAFAERRYRKSLFYNGDENIEGKIYTDRFIWSESKKARVDHYNYFDYMRLEYPSIINVLKLLNGNEDYLREGLI